MRANRTLLQHKYTNVIEACSLRWNVNLRQAMDIFYRSRTYQEMSTGVSDMHCRSDAYLAEEIELEGEGFTDNAAYTTFLHLRT